MTGGQGAVAPAQVDLGELRGQGRPWCHSSLSLGANPGLLTELAQVGSQTLPFSQVPGDTVAAVQGPEFWREHTGKGAGQVPAKSLGVVGGEGGAGRSWDRAGWGLPLHKLRRLLRKHSFSRSPRLYTTLERSQAFD